MILESLIQDESMLTLDCAKAHVRKGEKVEIKDKYWHSPEVQGAIKLGLVRLVGESPDVPKEEDTKPDPTLEPKKKYISQAETRMAFECETKFKDDQTGDPLKWKDYVDPGNLLWVPESAVLDRQIQNALSWGMLVDPYSTEKVRTRSDPVDLQEVVINESAGRRPAKRNSAIKAKSISSAGDPVEASDDDAMFQPSQVIDGQDLKPKAVASKRAREQGRSDDFLDVSAAAEKEKPEKLEEGEVAKEFEDDFGGSFQDLFGFDSEEPEDSKLAPDDEEF